MWFKNFLTFFLLLWKQIFIHAAGDIYFKKGAPHVQLANGGILSGAVKFSRDGRPYIEFLGIPYATVPERFKEPQPIIQPSWEGVFNATRAGHSCFQVRMGKPMVGYGAEQCLNLNVFVPLTSNGIGKQGYPIMVWIHGGGFMYGSANGIGPKYFMDEDVILVSINYRLGAFGFLSTGDGVISGNNGMKDIVVALKWIQQNIQLFGGNPSKVTIFGESAGGAAVQHLMLSPVTKGLFHRAISQSGSALNQWSYDPDPKQKAVDLATYLNCPTTASEPSKISSEEILTCLKAVPAKEFNKAQFHFKKGWPLNWRALNFAPSSEPNDCNSSQIPFQTESPVAILAREEDTSNADVPWMVGATEDEGAAMFAGFILSNPELLKELNSDWKGLAPSLFDYEKYLPKSEQSEVSEKLKEFYFGDEEISKETRAPLRNIFSDEMILHGCYESAMKTARMKGRAPVYLYQFAYTGPVSLGAIIFKVGGEEAEKVGHGDDLLYEFDLGYTGGKIKPDTPDEQFSKHFVRLLVSFADTGEPKYTWGNAASNKWEAISKEEAEGKSPPKWFRLDKNPASVEIAKSVKARMQFWDDLWYDFLTPASLTTKSSCQPNSVGMKETEA